MEQNGFIHRLRTETQLLHQQLEEELSLDRICESLDQYQTILIIFSSIWPALEAAISASPLSTDAKLGIEHRRRHHHLTEDLNKLGVVHTKPQLAVLPWKRLNAAEAAGVLYVMEGSTLGGRVICGALQEKLQITANHGARFFAGYGSENRNQWLSFLEWLDSTFTTPEQWSSGVTSAKQTFQLMLNHFSQNKLIHYND